MKKTAVFGISIIAFVLGVGIGVNAERERVRLDTENAFALPGGSGSVVGDPEQEVNIGLLWETWRTLNAYYIEPGNLKTDALVYGAVHGLVEAVGDPYTVFMTPEEDEEFFSALNGQLEGIGAELEVRDQQIVVVSPIKGAPAAEAGIMPGDVVVSANGTDLAGVSLNEAVTHIRGPQGTKVTLEIYREDEDELLTFEITRAQIHIPSVSSTIIERDGKKIAHLEINRFDDTVSRDVRGYLTDYTKQGDIDGVIIDVRYNGGGLLDAAVEIASYFLPDGDTVVSVARRNVDPEHLYTTGDIVLADMPLVMIVNEGSASASEILAGALQDNGRAKIIGKQSFGKGTVQEIVELPHGASIRVTTAKWLTPDGTDLGKMGITPDIEVDRTIEQFQSGDDPQLEKAIEELL